MKNVIRRCMNILVHKRIDEKVIPFADLEIPKENVICFNLSSNTILGIQKEDGLYFFRECLPITDAAAFIARKIHDFFAYIHNNEIEKLNFAQKPPIRIHFTEEEIEHFKEYLPDPAKDEIFLQDMIQMDQVFQKCGYSIWNRTEPLCREDFNAFGLPDLPETLTDIGTYFLWCMRGAASAFRTAKIASGRKLIFTNATKSVSTHIVADALGLSRLVTGETWCRLHIDAAVYHGVICRAADGQRGRDVTVEPSGALQRALMNLNVLDVICFQQDHGPNNYNVVFTDGVATGVCAFDNDNPNTFFVVTTVSSSLSGCAPLVSKNGLIDRPYFDVELAERLLELDCHALSKTLKPYLNALQRAAMVRRIRKLRKAIQKTAAHRDGFLIAPKDWGTKTLEEELGSSVANTYLGHLIRN